MNTYCDKEVIHLRGTRDLITEKGFTLIELVIVIVIIGILSIIGMPVYQKYVHQSIAAEGQSVVAAVMNGQRAFYAQNSAYAKTLAELDLAGEFAGNRYFQDAVVDVDDDGTNYTVVAEGIGRANGIIVTLTKQNGQAPDIRIDGI